MSTSNPANSSTATPQTTPVAIAAPIHEVDLEEPSTAVVLPDCPPPAYSPSENASNQVETISSSTSHAEAPPPYCLIDPSKIHTHYQHHPNITSPEIIDLDTSDTSQRQQAAISAWLTSGSNMDIGTDCTFLMAFIVSFFFNWLGFLAVVCLIPTISARFGAMSGFGLSMAKWITVMRYHDFKNGIRDPAQNFVFAIVLFAGFFLFVRGLISYIAVKNRANRAGQTAEIFTWY
ncbi:unnamed protein product [Didymodactylos carnosus]|uniref:Uncharacterized protein n=1 Tax=Didymodactylos carnosus TaxID=1234261 RepID=A0A813YBM0_9BILA|nr:unnamed protein product [Didymodactylos carnosus]CAF0974212.1 unnamed protein product [Didymodactylos carnosus]CAF3667998.1 unnamed protein product [Didymodactylos carnosus]CAF3745380.1 unnamed protein product [Didymodactylos carnosus]